MAKGTATADGHPKGAIRDRSQVRDSAPLKGVRREILFPTEPSTIGYKKIDRAVERVVARKK
jgi:hypothetical protein